MVAQGAGKEGTDGGGGGDLGNLNDSSDCCPRERERKCCGGFILGGEEREKAGRRERDHLKETR